MEDFAKVRVVRAPGERNGNVALRVEVSSDGGETWKQLPTATPAMDDGDYPVKLGSRKGHVTRVEIAIAVNSHLGGSVELDRIAAQ